MRRNLLLLGTLVMVAVMTQLHAAVINGILVDATDTTELMEATVRLVKAQKDRAFVKGTTYRIKGSANQTLTLIYILTANDVGASYRLVTIPISGTTFDIQYTHQHDNGTYIAVRGANTITSITVDLTIEVIGGLEEQVDKNKNKIKLEVL